MAATARARPVPRGATARRDGPPGPTPLGAGASAPRPGRADLLARQPRPAGEQRPSRGRGDGRARDRASFYARARVLLMPSLYEGFGLPCLEAMASGTPVVAANRAALPETCGDAALVVEPDEFATAALEAIDNQRLIDAGLERAARFTWERTARETDQAITSLRS